MNYEWIKFLIITYSAESTVEVVEGRGAGGGGVSNKDEGPSAGVIRDRLIDDGNRLYKSGVVDRIGVENSSLVAGGLLLLL